jgi:hypothetical protein
MWKVGLLFISVQGYISKMCNNLVHNIFPRRGGYKDKIVKLYSLALCVVVSKTTYVFL